MPGIETRCDLGLCDALRQKEMDEATQAYIRQNCHSNLEAMLALNPNLDTSECPIASFVSSVMERVEGDVVTGAENLLGSEA